MSSLRAGPYALLASPASRGQRDVAREQSDQKVGLACAQYFGCDTGDCDQEADCNLLGVATRRRRRVGQHEQREEKRGLQKRSPEQLGGGDWIDSAEAGQQREGRAKKRQH